MPGVEGPSDGYETYIPMLVVYFDIDLSPEHRFESKRIFEEIADAVRPFNGESY